jgi:cytochrome c-type biogenesis protein CcmH
VWNEKLVLGSHELVKPACVTWKLSSRTYGIDSGVQMMDRSSLKLYRYLPTAGLILCGLLLILTGKALAAPPYPAPSDDAVNSVARELYCPVCENTPLDVCSTQACAQWRDLIRQKLSEGWTRDQIKDYFVQQYGDRVLAEPPRQGLNWLVYVIPPLAFLVGVYILFRVLRQTRRVVPAPRIQPSLDDPYVARLEEELRRQEGRG